ncbi:hypothetical protein D3C80_2129170 [compost metagenome]
MPLDGFGNSDHTGKHNILLLQGDANPLLLYITFRQFLAAGFQHIIHDLEPARICSIISSLYIKRLAVNQRHI